MFSFTELIFLLKIELPITDTVLLLKLFCLSNSSHPNQIVDLYGTESLQCYRCHYVSVKHTPLPLRHLFV